MYTIEAILILYNKSYWSLFVMFFFLALVSPHSLQASEKDSIESWLDQGITLDEAGFDVISVDTILILKALELSKSIGDVKHQIYGYFYLGAHYNLIDQPVVGIEHLQSALRIANQQDSYTSMKEQIIMSIGNAYYKLSQYDKAEQYYKKALDENEKNGDFIDRQGILINLSSVITRLGRTQEALDIYLKVYDESLKLISSDSKYEHFLNIARSNLGFIYMLSGEAQQAFQYLSSYHEYVLQQGNPHAIAPSYSNLAYCHYLLRNFDQAYELYYKSIDISEANDLHHISSITYKDMSETYQADGKMNLAYKYLNKHYQLKDSIQGIKVQKKLQQLDSEHKNSMQQQEITKLEQKNHIQRQRLFITYGGIVSLLALGFFTFRNMWITSKHRKEITEEKLKQTQQREELQILKVEQLNKELEFKKQDITRLAIDINQKQEFSDELLQKMKKVKQFIRSEGSKEWRILEQTIKERLQINDEQIFFNDNIDKINQSFYNNLKDNYPTLSKNDLNLCGFIRLGLSNKEIANLRGVSHETIRVGKFRLRKKLNYDSNEEVEQFLQSV